MSEKQVSARLQGVVKTLNERATPLLGEIDQYVHAENHVHPADIHSRSQIHLRKGDELPQPRFHLMPALIFREVCRQLLLVDAAQATARIDAAFRMLQSVPPHVGSENLHVPRIRKGK